MDRPALPPGVKLFRRPKSYNSQIGVPLSLLMTAGDEQIAVIEAGISRKGEMQSLERIVRPDIGIITNIGDAHQENFDTPEEKGRRETEPIRPHADDYLQCRRPAVAAPPVRPAIPTGS